MHNLVRRTLEEHLRVKLNSKLIRWPNAASIGRAAVPRYEPHVQFGTVEPLCCGRPKHERMVGRFIVMIMVRDTDGFAPVADALSKLSPGFASQTLTFPSTSVVDFGTSEYGQVDGAKELNQIKAGWVKCWEPQLQEIGKRSQREYQYNWVVEFEAQAIYLHQQNADQIGIDVPNQDGYWIKYDGDLVRELETNEPIKLL